MPTDQTFNALANLGKPTKAAVVIGHALQRTAAAAAKAAKGKK